MSAHELDTEKLAALLKQFEFTSLVRRLPKHMQRTARGNLFDSMKAESAAPVLKEVPWPKNVDT